MERKHLNDTGDILEYEIGLLAFCHSFIHREEGEIFLS
jgi:hypothetical protein